MKKIINYLLIAATVCGISLAAVSCSKDDDNDILPPVEEPDDGANSGGTGIGYIKRSWDEAAQKVVDEPLAVNAEDIRTLKPNSWHSGAKYISGSYTIDGYLGADGGTTLDVILCDGAQLTTEGGIFRLEGAAGDCLNIFAQSEGTGKIIVNAADEENVAISCDVLNIHGGQLSITNSLYSGIAAAVFSMWSGKLEVSTTNDACHAIFPGTTVKLYNDLQLFERNSPEEKWGSVAPNADTVNEYISAKPYVKIEAPSPGFNANDPFGKGGDPLAGGN